MRLPEAPELIEAAMRQLGAKTDKQLAFLLWKNYSVEADQPKVNRWRRGTRAPNYAATIALLQAAGWLNVGGSPADDATADRAGELLEAAVEKLEEALAQVRAALPSTQRRAPG